MTTLAGPIAPGSGGASLARRLYRSSPVRALSTARVHRGIQPSDVILASYPRSGSLWMRFLLMETLVGHSDFIEFRRAVPELHEHHLASTVLPDGGRVLKSHELYRDRYRRAIHLVRDPRDVAISYFRFMQRIGKIVVRPGDDVDASFDRFIAAMLIPNRVDAFGTWQSHLFSWTRAAESGRAQVLRVRYEDVHSDTAGRLREIAAFLGLELSDEDAQRVAERTSIERMRAAEQHNMQTHDTPFARRGRTSGIGAVNTGRVEAWRERMTSAQIARFRVFERGLTLMGYPLA